MVDLRDVIAALRTRRAMARFTATSDVAVAVHLFYAELWPVLAARLARITPTGTDLYVTVPRHHRDAIGLIRESFPNARCVVVPNRGRDVLPFLLVARRLAELGYVAVLKVHSKKSEHFGGGERWRDGMLDELMPEDPAVLTDVLTAMRRPSTGVLGPKSAYFPLSTYWTGNAACATELLRPAVSSDALARLATPEELGFFAGTMFWARLDALTPLLTVRVRAFAREPTPKDGTLAHALERAMSVLPELLGREDYDCDGVRVASRPALAEPLPQWYVAATQAAGPV